MQDGHAENVMNGTQVAINSANRQCRKCLIMTGDDFGLNSRVNEAVEQLYQAGILTQASLMVNEAGVDEALRIARRHPGLVVGLHLSLCCGLASKSSFLTDAQGRLSPSPAQAGVWYAFKPALRLALRAEIEAQFAKFAALGLPPVYWDGHTHLHLHPEVLKLTLPVAAAAGFRAVRLVREPGWTMLPVIFRLLSRAAQPKLARYGIRYVDRLFGLRHTGRVTTRVLENWLGGLPEGWSEIYFHPGAEPADFDTEILRELIELEKIGLGTARDLP